MGGACGRVRPDAVSPTDSDPKRPYGRNVEIRVCDMRGKVDPHTTVHHGTAHVRDDANALTDVKDAVLRKYGWQARLVRLTDTIKERLGRGENPIAVPIDIKPTSPTPF